MKRYNHGDMYTLNLITLDIFEEGSKIHHTDKETKNRKMKSGRETVSIQVTFLFHLSVGMFIKYMVSLKIKA